MSTRTSTWRGCGPTGRHHAFPSMTRLCEVVGLPSTASVFDLVSRLKDAGFVQRVAMSAAAMFKAVGITESTKAVPR